MPKNVMCKNCNNLKHHWCKAVLDSPDEDMLRNCRHFWQKTNADRIRAMSDEELAQQLLLFTDLDDRIRYCKDLPECQKALDDDVEIPADRCRSCLLSWLQQPAEVDNG